MRRSLQCYAWGREGDWHGLCTDLDIAVDGRSSAEVRTTLNAAVRDYVESAQNEAPDDRDRLLDRRAPVHVRLGLYLSYNLSRLVHAVLKGPEGHQAFHCPA